MADDHAEKWRAHRTHMAAVPGAIAAAKQASEPDEFGDMPPTCSLPGATLRTLVAEVERLQAALQQAHKDAREEQLEFQREARDIAAEARWEERQSRDGDYGSY